MKKVFEAEGAETGGEQPSPHETHFSVSSVLQSRNILFS